MSLLTVSGLSRVEEGSLIVNDISFSQERFQKLAIAGATGSGKTSLLKMVAGLLQPTSGTVYFQGKRVLGPEERLIPGHPGIGYLSQYFELRNHYRVEELLAMSSHLGAEEVKTIAEVCRVDHLMHRWSHQLSGGEKQRIALAIVLVAAPSLLLLDEPFSNLDGIHKNILKSVIDDIGEHLEITCLLISHDPLDTLSWADMIYVLKGGSIVQQGTPVNIYREPVNEYVAALFGKYNILTPALALAISEYTDLELNRINSFIRPEEFKRTEEGKGVEAIVESTRFCGHAYEVRVLVQSKSITMLLHNDVPEKGDHIYISL
ncbi:MAG TPA: ABC transporter ATP-binding protein [Flavisolibacter sp.]|nr:ABC transporter ATP-binding protein [Flavisolibacter sp.]